MPMTGRNDTSWMGKIRTFIPGSRSGNHGRGSKAADGWMKTGSGDEWDSESGDEGGAARMQELDHTVYTPGTAGSMTPPTPND